jgi:hypothetical protein
MSKEQVEVVRAHLRITMFRTEQDALEAAGLRE